MMLKVIGGLPVELPCPLVRVALVAALIILRWQRFSTFDSEDEAW